jgi:ABC-2 type transport system permease protein
MTGIRAVFRKEMADHLGSRRFAVIATIIVLASLAASLAAVESPAIFGADREYLFLSLLTESGGPIPSFLYFITFLAPLLGIILGFDAINAERQRGTLSLLVSQPIYRDSVINGKFLAALSTAGIMTAAILALIGGVSIAKLGIVPGGAEIARTAVFFVASMLYIGFWLSLSILFSVLFDKTSTSALAALAVWIVLGFFLHMIAGIVADQVVPVGSNSAPQELIRHEQLRIAIMRLSPAYLLQEVSLAVLNPAVRIMGPLSPERLQGFIPSPLSLGQSLMVVWPQLTLLAALSIVCFGISYVVFMRREVRS